MRCRYSRAFDVYAIHKRARGARLPTSRPGMRRESCRAPAWPAWWRFLWPPPVGVTHKFFFRNLRGFSSVDPAHVFGGLPRYRPGLCPVVGPGFWCPARLTRARPFLFNDVWRPRLLWRPSGRKVRKEKGRKHRGQVRERRNASRRSRFGNRCGYFAPQPPTKTKFCGWPVKHSKARFGVPFACYQAPRIAYKTAFSTFAGVCPVVPRYPVARCPYVAAARLAPCRCGVAFWRAKARFIQFLGR